MNILFIGANSPYESVGGVERYFINLINFCKKHTTSRIIIILPSFSESYEKLDENVLIYFDKNIGLQKNITALEISKKAHLFSKEIEKIIKKHNIDIICAENFHVGLPAAFSILLNMVAGLNKIPCVLRLHSFATTELQVELVNQLLWKKISCVSKSVTGDCFQKGADINILSTDYLGVDTSEFNRGLGVAGTVKRDLGFSEGEKIILTATRIIHGRKSILKEKGLINLVEAFSKLSPRYPLLRLLIAIGKPPDILSAEFEQSKSMLLGYLKLNNVDTTTVVKMFPLSEMAGVYRESDLFVLPSENETFGQVFVEAMSSGVPVIGTKVGGIPEIISDSYNGFLVPSNDSSVLAQMIERLIKEKSTRESFIANGIKTVEEKFTSEKQFSRFINFLEKTAKES